jgi:hypothetical protein
MASSRKRKAVASPEVFPPKKEESVQQAELNETEIKLVQWEEWALTTEEHFHAEDLHARMPNGPSMGHIHR